MGVVRVRSRKYFGPDGQCVQERPLPSINSAWDRIYRPLRDAMPADSLHAGRALVRVTRNDSVVVAEFSDGSVQEGDLLVGADGLHSGVRRLTFGDNISESFLGGYLSVVSVPKNLAPTAASSGENAV